MAAQTSGARPARTWSVGSAGVMLMSAVSRRYFHPQRYPPVDSACANAQRIGVCTWLICRRHATCRDLGDPMGALWHPFSNMSLVEKNGEFVLVRGEGCYVYDVDGKRYLDATAGLWYANVGHGRVELADIAAKQMAALASYNIFGDYSSEPAIALAEKLAGIAPMAG